MARGYLKDPIRTAEKFLPDPFFEQADARMYRTGDLARWRDNGVVEFLGRMDNQVKIHGYRIEPGEIEIALRTHKTVNQACVVPHTDAERTKRLVGYFTTADNKELTGSELKQFLSSKIPAYMVPAVFVRMDAFASFCERKSRAGRIPRARVRKRRSAGREKRGDGARGTKSRSCGSGFCAWSGSD